MILTVNANAAIDHVLLIEDMEERGTIRADRAIDCIGGKGADAALVLSRLNAPHTLVSFVAGAYGQILNDLFTRNEIRSELIWVEGETRVVTVIIEAKRNDMTQISNTGYHVTSQDCDRFYATLKESAVGTSWCIAAGSLPVGAPDDFYGQVCKLMHEAGVKVLIDASGQSLIQSLQQKPEIIKLNKDEFESAFKVTSGTIESIEKYAHELIDAHQLKMVMVTLGDDGILLVTSAGSVHVRGPVLNAVNPAGAGDATSAAFVYRLSLNDSLTEALRWACAAGAASVLTEVTADLSLDTVRSLLPQVKVYQTVKA